MELIMLRLLRATYRSPLLVLVHDTTHPIIIAYGQQQRRCTPVGGVKLMSLPLPLL
jgi:hypothetical protein